MTNLNIHVSDKQISIALPSGEISIAIGEQKAEPKAVQEISAPKLEWSNTLLDGESVNYESAEKAIAELGEGWRMPTRFELETLLDLSRHDPAIDTEKYPDTKSKYYWTSTPCAWNEAAVWVVNFDHGGVDGLRRSHGRACVRAVRSSQ